MDGEIGDSGTHVSVLYREDSLFTWSRISFQDFSGSMCLARVVEEAVFLRIGLRRDRNIISNVTNGMETCLCVSSFLYPEYVKN